MMMQPQPMMMNRNNQQQNGHIYQNSNNNINNGAPINIPIQHVNQQQLEEQEWKAKLEANSVAIASNAADFTRNFLNQPFSPSSGPAAVPSAMPRASVPTDKPAAGPGQNVTAPTRGRGVLNQQKPGMRVPMCGACDDPIR